MIALSCDGYSFWLCVPTEPGTPFGTPLLIALDSIRVGCVVLALVLTVWSLTMLVEADQPGQRWRLVGLALLAVAVMGTELSRLGDWAHYRLVLNVGGIVAGVVGLAVHRRYERTVRDR